MTNSSLKDFHSDTSSQLISTVHPLYYLYNPLFSLQVELELSDCVWDRLMIGSLRLCGVIETSLALELSTVINSTNDVLSFRFIADSVIHDKGYAFHWRLSSKYTHFTSIYFVMLYCD